MPNPLRGDGLEPTPDIDVSDREVIQLPSDEFVDALTDVSEEIGGSGSSSNTAPDASAGDAGGADSGADAADGAP